MAEVSLESALTLIITTSITPSAPSTELISLVLDSFAHHCPPLLQCRVIVVFDGYDYIVSKARLKKGCVTSDQASNYNAYKVNVKELIIRKYCPGEEQLRFTTSEAKAEYGYARVIPHDVDYLQTQTLDGRITFIEPVRRIGFGLAVRSALRATETSYVWIQQHDWTLISHIPLEEILQVMIATDSNADNPIKYICFPTTRMLDYAESDDVTRFSALKHLTASLKCDFSLTSRSGIKIPLTPMFFWHDKPHVASTAHYLERVFPSPLAMLRGDFIEDKIGQRARNQMKEGLWQKWATWLYYPGDGKSPCVKHLMGRTWLGTEEEALKVTKWQQLNKGGMSGDNSISS